MSGRGGRRTLKPGKRVKSTEKPGLVQLRIDSFLKQFPELARAEPRKIFNYGNNGTGLGKGKRKLGTGGVTVCGGGNLEYCGQGTAKRINMGLSGGTK